MTFRGLSMAALMVFSSAGAAQAETIKVGLLGGVSGPIAAMAPAMLDAAKLAFDQVNAAGGVGAGNTIKAVIGDSGCNPQNATDAATKAVNLEGVSVIVGPHCSGAVIAATNSVTIPAGVSIITPSGTSPEISSIDDNDTVFRTVPSDAYQGQALARAVLARGTDRVDVAYLNNDYGKGLADAFKAEYEAIGGIIESYEAHEEGKASYRSNLAAMARGDAHALIIFDYGDGSGLTILRQALENGFFSSYVGGDGMKSDAIIEALGGNNLAFFSASSPVGEESNALEAFEAAFTEAGGDKDAIFVTTSYDAAFMAALALEKAGGDKAGVAAALRAISNGQGEAILPGEWAKAKGLIASGTAIDYKGAAGDHNFDENGDVPGTYALFKVSGDAFESVGEIK